MPIQRFGSTAHLEAASSTPTCPCCSAAHRDENLEQVMCRSLLSIDWQGYAYDCDFNQMLGPGRSTRRSGPPHCT
jgi:hypothetical protein